MDALADQADDSARRLLGQLVLDYPRSPEAIRAKRALAALDSGHRPADERLTRADQAERIAQYRRAFLVDIGDRVFFAENSATIGGRARSILENQAHWLKSRPVLNVIVIGRADDGGDRNQAMALSRQRAEAVRDRLVSGGLGAERIELRAAGDKDPLALCTTALCQAQNRNVEVFISDAGRGGAWQSSQDTPASTISGGKEGAGALAGAVDDVPQ
jgi:peptidoglycan-associated lipoprotein